MELFVCSSNYQLLNAIMVINQYGIEADILIIRESIWIDCNLEVLKENGIVRNVYRWTVLLEMLGDEKIKNPVDKIKIQALKIYTYMNKWKIWDTLPNKNKKYKIINIAYIDSISLWIYYYFKLGGAVLSLFEDGTYSYRCLEVKKSIFRRVAERILYGGKGIDESIKMYVKHPEKVEQGKHCIKLLDIQEKVNESMLDKILLPLYKSSRDVINEFNRKVIFFDQNMELSEIKKAQKSIARKAVEMFGKDNTIVKLHPSSRDVYYGEGIQTFCEKLPFELVLSSQSMDNKILISIFSTACMSPKLDFNQEPYVIFTYKLYGDMFCLNKLYLDQIKQLSSCYNAKGRIFVPENMVEYTQILESIKEKIL